MAKFPLKRNNYKEPGLNVSTRSCGQSLTTPFPAKPKKLSKSSPKFYAFLSTKNVNINRINDIFNLLPFESSRQNSAPEYRSLNFDKLISSAQTQPAAASPTMNAYQSMSSANSGTSLHSITPQESPSSSNTRGHHNLDEANGRARYQLIVRNLPDRPGKNFDSFLSVSYKIFFS